MTSHITRQSPSLYRSISRISSTSPIATPPRRESAAELHALTMAQRPIGRPVGPGRRLELATS